MVLGFRRLTTKVVFAAVTALFAGQASIADEHELECAQFLAGNIHADGTLLNATYHRGVIIPKGSILGFDQQCKASWANTVQAVNYKGVQLAPGKLTFNEQGNLEFAPLATSVLPNGASVIGAHEIRHSNTVLSAEEQFKQEVFGKNVTAFFDSGFPKQAYLNNPSNIDGVWYDISNEPIKFNADGTVASGTLERNAEFGRFTMGPGPVRFDDNGSVREGRLGVDTRVGDLVLPAQTQIKIDALGLPESFVLKSQASLNQASSNKVKLGEVWLFANTRYNLSDTQHLVEFQSSDYTWFQERLYPPFTQIQLAADGLVEWDSYYSQLENASIEQIEQGDFPEVLKYAQVLRGVYLPKGSLVFMSHGLAQRVVIPREFNYSNIALRAGPIYFNGAHSVRGTLAKETVIYGVTVPRLSELEFHHGRVVRVDAPSNLLSGGIWFDGRRVEFRDNGVIRSGVLAQLTAINNVLYDTGTQVLLDANGAVIRTRYIGPKPDGGDANAAASDVAQLQDFPSDNRCDEINRAYNDVRTDLYSVFEVRACSVIWANNELED